MRQIQKKGSREAVLNLTTKIISFRLHGYPRRGLEERVPNPERDDYHREQARNLGFSPDEYRLSDGIEASAGLKVVDNEPNVSIQFFIALLEDFDFYPIAAFYEQVPGKNHVVVVVFSQEGEEVDVPDRLREAMNEVCAAYCHVFSNPLEDGDRKDVIHLIRQSSSTSTVPCGFLVPEGMGYGISRGE